MTLHTYNDIEQRSDEWFALRRGILTASNVGKLLTSTLKVASNDESRGLTAQLVAERITGDTDSSFVNADMMRGVEAEPFARDVYSTHFHQAEEVGFMRRDEDGWSLGFSPDGLVGTDGLLEIKAPRSKTHLRTILADEVPPFYMAQLMAGLLVSGRDWIDFCSFVGGMPLYVKRVYPDPKWFEAIEAACRRFEEVAAEMVTDYSRRIEGMPRTERIDFELVI